MTQYDMECKAMRQCDEWSKPFPHLQNSILFTAKYQQRHRTSITGINGLKDDQRGGLSVYLGWDF